MLNLDPPRNSGLATRLAVDKTRTINREERKKRAKEMIRRQMMATTEDNRPEATPEMEALKSTGRDVMTLARVLLEQYKISPKSRFVVTNDGDHVRLMPAHIWTGARLESLATSLDTAVLEIALANARTATGQPAI